MNRRYTLLLLLAIMAAPMYPQGFGTFSFNKKSVTINRLLPPTVNLNGKHVRVDASANAIQDGAELSSLLKADLLTLIQTDPRYIIDESSPETILKFTVTNYYVEPWNTEVNAKKKVVYRGKIEVAYQAIDAATKSARDSEILTDEVGYNPENSSIIKIPDIIHSTKSEKKQEAAEASVNEARDQLLNDIVNKMGKRIAPLEEPFDAPLPTGKLESISNLALNRRWGDVEERAEKMPPFSKPEEDTYRQYLIAIALEAQAYDMTREANDHDLGKRTDITQAQAERDYQNAQNYLDKAGEIYKKIIETNPKEKVYRDGDARTEEAITIYARIERYKQEYLKAQAAKAVQVKQLPAAATVSTAVVAPNRQSPLDQILNFCSNGLALATIKDYIASPDFMEDAKATNYRYDFEKDPIRLHAACKQNTAVIQHLMRTRLNPPAAHR